MWLAENCRRHAVPSRILNFTGKERGDGATEGGLDYFGARYFSSAQGRFTSPDQPFADQHPEDPQSWNMYGYVRNNPLKNTDPDGRLCIFGIGSCTPSVTSTISYPEEPITTPLFLAVAKGMNDAAPVVNATAEATMMFVSGPGIGMLEEMAAPVAIAALGVSEGPTPTASQTQAGNGVAAPRLPQDINVNPVPPAANNGSGTVGPSPTQNAQVQTDVGAARAAGHTDIRVNQQQTNAQGERVGVNRPDVQSTDANGVRRYSEYDRSAQNAADHHTRTLANDPNGVTHTIIIK